MTGPYREAYVTWKITVMDSDICSFVITVFLNSLSFFGGVVGGILEIIPRALHVVDKYSANELYSQHLKFQMCINEAVFLYIKNHPKLHVNNILLHRS